MSTDKGGRYPRVTETELLGKMAQLLANDEKPILTTTEIADEIPIGKRATRDRLNKLADDGTIGRLSVGNSTVWWLNTEA